MLSLLCLGAGGINRPIRKCLAFFQPRRDGNAMHSSGLLILLPCRSRDISSHDSFNWEDLVFAYLHTPILESGSLRLWDLRGEIEGDEVSAKRRYGVLEDFEPSLCAECEQLALVWDALKRRKKRVN